MLYAWTTAGKDVFHSDTRDVAKSGLPTISLGKKELTAGSNCLGKQRHWVILEEQLHKKVRLNNKKACIAFPWLHPWDSSLILKVCLLDICMPCFLVLTYKPTIGTLAQPYTLLETSLLICRIFVWLCCIFCM